MLRWLRRLLPRKRRPATAVVAVARSLPPDGPLAGRRRITTTAEDFAAHLARRAGRPPP